MPSSFGPPGCPYDPGAVDVENRPIPVQTVTLHRTIGTWPGDYSVGKNRNLDQGTFQYLIGQDDGQWVQFYKADRFASHAAGANRVGPGLEISGQNGEALTDWQIDALGDILRWLRDEWGVAPTYTMGDPRVYADQEGPLGFISHSHVAYPPNPSYQHYDYITPEEFDRALGGAPAPPPAPAFPAFALTGEPAMSFASAVTPSAGIYETYRITDDGTVQQWYFPRQSDGEHADVATGGSPGGDVQVIRQTTADGKVGRGDVWFQRPDGSLGHAFQHGYSAGATPDWTWNVDTLGW